MIVERVKSELTRGCPANTFKGRNSVIATRLDASIESVLKRKSPLSYGRDCAGGANLPSEPDKIRKGDASLTMFSKTGSAAAASATAEKETKQSAIVSFGSGTTLKVRVKSPDDSAEYFAYGIFGSVNTFVPKNPSERNAKGYVSANPTVWDRAEEHLRGEAKALKDAGKEDAAKKKSDEAYLYKAKPRYLIAFGNLADGADIVVDLSKKQAAGVLVTIAKYAKKLDKVAFELSKTGSGTSTSVTLTPILDMDEDLTEVERKNFEKCGASPFDFAKFEDCLYVADEGEQVKFLIQAGFDIGKLGLTYGGTADEAPPIDDKDAPPDVDF